MTTTTTTTMMMMMTTTVMMTIMKRSGLFLGNAMSTSMALICVHGFNFMMAQMTIQVCSLIVFVLHLQLFPSSCVYSFLAGINDKESLTYWSCHDGEMKTSPDGNGVRLTPPGGSDPNDIASHYRCDEVTFSTSVHFN